MNRINRLQAKMEGRIEAALIRDGSNRRYLTGMKSSAGTVLVTRNKAWLIIDFRYLEEAEAKARDCQVIEEKELCSQVTQLLDSQGIHRVSIASASVTMEEGRMLKDGMPKLTVDDSGVLSGIMEEIRMQKDEEEIGWHRRAQDITDQAFTHILDVIRPGITELDVARELGYTMEKLGSDDRHYNFIVASGPNSSLPHGFATDRVLQKGDFLTMDFGAVINGYFADMTRTVALGSISGEQRKVYDTVYEAQKRAFDRIRPGAVCREVDAAARDYIYGQGYEGCFSHGLGHSVGIDVHENPRFNEKCGDRLIPGIVITVEPGIYLKHRFGVRIEDMIVIREDGFEDLAHSKRELILL